MGGCHKVQEKKIIPVCHKLSGEKIIPKWKVDKSVGCAIGKKGVLSDTRGFYGKTKTYDVQGTS